MESFVALRYPVTILVTVLNNFYKSTSVFLILKLFYVKVDSDTLLLQRVLDWNNLTTWWLKEWLVKKCRKTQSNGSQSIYLM